MKGATGSYTHAEGQRVYREKLKPAFSGLPFQPNLDERNEFYIEMLASHGVLQNGRHLVDLGAGLSVFGPMVRQLGPDVTLIDDFGGGGGVLPGQQSEDITLLDRFRDPLGVKIIKINFLETPIPLPEASVDVVTCFHSLEHWHHSPRRLFREIVRILRPGGVLILATPNAVNLRKRVYVVTGRSNFPRLREWYEDGEPVFRGHVREPVIRDLRELMEWNGFEVTGVYGRNFIGRDSEVLAWVPKPLLRATAATSQAILRFFPSLCSDIHVVGRKRA